MAVEIIEHFVAQRCRETALAALDRIFGRYPKLQKVELAQALGLASDTGGVTQVSRWVAGTDVPGRKTQAVLDLIADGVLALEVTGKVNRRRRAYRIVASEELAA